MVPATIHPTTPIAIESTAMKTIVHRRARFTASRWRLRWTAWNASLTRFCVALPPGTARVSNKESGWARMYVIACSRVTPRFFNIASENDVGSEYTACW